ncbi:tRNA 2-thiouridine(34) synthase MnmA [Patescibacteria group bacterium]|nr:tRNA 2-thiouridine(34) synthase MnmA [Patescibacteria group bacterium]MBU4458499.1 tRNA 2-thiouridine(34) synthase MnmA [Patescibacteria group bacterium]MCG2696367.1 tRNA 2-thiouridine(34) synthase MnmA [Candidatus Portnoybacteria bacterium]
MENNRPACRRGRVIVAMSGGVDSSVAAAVLKSRRYDVIGIFILMHKNSNPQDAKMVAKKLKIDFKILDARKEFRKWVIDYAFKEYKLGNTPNPCVECNRRIKFKFLLEIMAQLKADYIATGHYAKIKKGKLFIAKDIKKDQTYFLWTLKQKQLKKILFPLGDYTKKQVRGLAEKFKLPINKKESQDMCFSMPHRSPDSIGTKSGDILTTDGKIIGQHKGLFLYTIGQRKGIEIGGTGPYYVIRKDFKNNTLIVSQSQKDLLQKEMVVKNINWLSGKLYSGKCKIKIRSTAKLADAIIKNNRIIFNKPQRAITSGQSAVIYRKGEVLGGGKIL